MKNNTVPNIQNLAKVHKKKVMEVRRGEARTIRLENLRYTHMGQAKKKKKKKLRRFSYTEMMKLAPLNSLRR
jgi:hypothetical protein